MSIINNKSAFSMTEIMVACLALGIMLVPVFTMFSKSSAGTTRNKNDILAQQHAANLLAYATALEYSDDFINAGDYTIKDKSVSTSDGTEIDLSIEEDIFTRTMEVKEYNITSVARDYKLIAVKVEWKQAGDKSEQLKNIKLTGLVYK